MKNTLIRTTCRVGAGLRSVFGPLRSDSTHLLMYHRVAPAPPGISQPTLNVEPDRFESQISGLLRQGYRFAPLSELVQAAESGEPTPLKTLCITFDDGYENMYTRVFPVVKRLQVPVSIFICTQWLDQQSPMPFDDWGKEVEGTAPAECYCPMTWEQCREMHESGLVEFGAHTHSHSDFRGDVSGFYEDMQICLESMQRNLGIERPDFAFPFGRVDEGFATPEMIDAARCAGVASALTTEPGPIRFSQSPFTWGRNNVFEWDTARTIDARLTGWYQWLPNLRRRVRRVLRIASHPIQRTALPSSSSSDEEGSTTQSDHARTGANS